MDASQRLPAIYWINLARSSERRARMELRFREHGVEHRRVEAIDGLDEASLHRVIRWHGSTATEAACLASHLLAIRTAYDRGETEAAIMEDDASFELLARRPRSIAPLIEALPPNWSALMMCIGDDPKGLDRVFRNPLPLQPYGTTTVWSTVAYVVHRRAMAWLLDAYDRGTCFDVRSFSGEHVADRLIFGSLQRAAGLAEPYLVRVPLFTFDVDGSDVHPDHLPHQIASRDFVLGVYDDLLNDRYRSPLSVMHRLAASLRRARTSS